MLHRDELKGAIIQFYRENYKEFFAQAATWVDVVQVYNFTDKELDRCCAIVDAGYLKSLVKVSSKVEMPEPLKHGLQNIH